MSAKTQAEMPSGEAVGIAPFVAGALLIPILISLLSDTYELIGAGVWIDGALKTREATAFQAVIATLVVAIFVALRGQADARHLRLAEDTYMIILFYALFALSIASATIGWNQLLGGEPDYLALTSLLSACISVAIVALATLAGQMVPAAVLKGFERRVAERHAAAAELSRRNLFDSSGTVGSAILWSCLLVLLPAVTFLTAVILLGARISVAGFVAVLGLCAAATALLLLSLAAYACSRWFLLVFSSLFSLLLVLGLVGSWASVGGTQDLGLSRELGAFAVLILSFVVWWAVLYQGLLKAAGLRRVLLQLVLAVLWCRDRQISGAPPGRPRTVRRWRSELRAVLGRGELPTRQD